MMYTHFSLLTDEHKVEEPVRQLIQNIQVHRVPQLLQLFGQHHRIIQHRVKMARLEGNV